MKRLLRVFGVATLFLLLLVAACLLALRPPAPLALPGQGVELSGVELVVPGEWRSGPVDLVVRDSTIVEVIPSKGPVTDWVLPGLADAHMHAPMLPFPGEDALYAFLHLYHGITTARMAAGDASMRDALATGSYPGPRLSSCGPFIDGDPPLWPSSLVVTDAAGAREAVAEVAAAGYDCVKVYNELNAEASQAIHEAARAAGLPVIGHVPWRQDAADAWIDDQQHLLGLPAPDGSDDTGRANFAMLRLDSVDAPRLDDLAEAMLRRDVALTPTLVTLERKASLQSHAAQLERDDALLLPRYYREQLWHPEGGLVSARLFSDAEHERFRAVYTAALNALRTLHDRGVELRTGTDAPAEAIVPGAGLVEELSLLAEAGFSAEEVLAMSSVTTARALRGSDYATLSVGSVADFVVYGADPTVDLANLDSRRAVVVNGRLYTREALDAQRRRYQAWFDSPAYRVVSGGIVGAGLWLVNRAPRAD